MDQIFIQHRFTIEQNGMSFSDAIVLPQDEYNKLGDQDIETIKQQRFDAWQQVLKNPPQSSVVPIDVQLADITTQIQSLQDQIDVLTPQQVELQDTVDAQVSPVLETPVVVGGK